MSSTTDAGGSASSSPETITYHSVASIDKTEVLHDIVINDFQVWRNNVEFLGPIEGSFGIPISTKTPMGVVVQDVRE